MYGGEGKWLKTLAFWGSCNELERCALGAADAPLCRTNAASQENPLHVQHVNERRVLASVVKFYLKWFDL